MADVTLINQLPFPELDDTADIPRDFEALANKLDPGIVPVGAMMMWPSAAAPNEAWLLCQGQTDILATDYPELAAILGVVGANIKMPNLTGRVAVGAGPLPAASPAKTAVLGSADGVASVKLNGQQSGIKKHSHAASSAGKALGTVAAGSHSHGGATVASNPAHDHGYLRGSARLFNNGSGTITAAASYITTSPSTQEAARTDVSSINHAHGINADGSHAHTVNGNTGDIADQDAALPHDNMPPYYAVNYIIRAK